MSSKERLLNDISMMMTDPTQAQNDTKIESIMQDIRILNPKKASDQLRLASCHFMTMYHTRKAMTIGMNDDPRMQQQAQMMGQMMGQPAIESGGASADQVDLASVERFKQAQYKDMELGWTFLCSSFTNVTAARTARVLKIEVAQRLEDSIKLKQAFDDLMGFGLSEEENMVAFTAAPFLGDWRTMMKLGKRIEKMPGGMEQLHMMSLQLPIPDFTLIYELCKEYKLNKKPQPKIESLKWNLLNVKKIRIRFKDVDCGEFEEKRQELMAEINKLGADWEDVPNTSHVHVKRMGALCQAVSFGEIPMMLNGPWLDDKIHVRGRAEMPLMDPETQAQMSAMQAAGGNPYMGGGGMPDPSQLTILIQDEEWILDKDPNREDVYIGTYALKQRPQPPKHKKMTPENAPVNMLFDCEVFVGDEDSQEEQKDANDSANGVGDEKTKKKKKKSGDDADSDECAQEDDEAASKKEEMPIITEFDDLELD